VSGIFRLIEKFGLSLVYKTSTFFINKTYKTFHKTHRKRRLRLVLHYTFQVHMMF
jgi:hypothetical protein